METDFINVDTNFSNRSNDIRKNGLGRYLRIIDIRILIRITKFFTMTGQTHDN